jgi:hypothetical protein
MGRGADGGPALRAEEVRAGEAEAEAAQAEERVGLVRQVEGGKGLVAADVEGAQDEGPAAEALQEAAIDAVLLFLVRQVGAAHEEELGAEQADAVARPQEVVRHGLGVVDIEHDGDGPSVGRDGRFGEVLRGLGRFAPGFGEAALVVGQVEGAGSMTGCR